MGSRIVYQILDCGDRSLIATLFSNSSHTTQYAEEVFSSSAALPECRIGPNALLERLLSMRYETAEGNHREGDRIFWIVPAGDVVQSGLDGVLTATFVGHIEELAARRPVTLGQWQLTRIPGCE